MGGLIGYSYGYRTGIQSVIKTPSSEEKSTVEKFFEEPEIGRLKVDVPEEYTDSLVDAEAIYALPEKPSNNEPTGNIKGLKPFNLGEDLGELSLTIPESIESRVLSETEIDIDNDQKPEKAILYTVTGAGSLNFLRMVKNDKVIFEYMGSGISIHNAYGHPNGFVLSTETWQIRNGKRIRYVIKDDGLIVPLWQQRYIGIES